jgi:hypothetical protein
MTVKSGLVNHQVPGHGAKARSSNALSGRQPGPGQMRHSTADQQTDTSMPGLGCLRSFTPPARARREEHHPLPTNPTPAGATRYFSKCLQPVLLRGRVEHIDGATGELLHRYATAHEPGPATPPPLWATVALLTAAIGQAARAVQLATPGAPGLPSRSLAWGRQLDTRPITTAGELTDAKVAAYVAKYATKAAECTGTLDRRLTPADRLTDLPIRDHARRHIGAWAARSAEATPTAPRPGRRPSPRSEHQACTSMIYGIPATTSLPPAALACAT